MSKQLLHTASTKKLREPNYLLDRRYMITSLECVLPNDCGLKSSAMGVVLHLRDNTSNYEDFAAARVMEAPQPPRFLDRDR